MYFRHQLPVAIWWIVNIEILNLMSMFADPSMWHCYKISNCVTTRRPLDISHQVSCFYSHH